MDEFPLLAENHRKPLFDRFLAFFEILMMSGVLSSALAISVFPRKSLELITKDAQSVSFFLLLEAGIAVLLLVVILKAHREPAVSLGLHWNHWKSNLIIGLALVPVLFLINTAVALAFRFFLPDYYIEQNPLTAIIKTPRQLALFIISALFAGGIKEELQRAFILNRFSRYLGGAGLGLLIWSLVFGLGHYVQGLQGIVITTFCGLIFGATYLLRKSLIGPIIAHGLYDTLALLFYWFSAGRFQ